jgi:hypothetical protein
MASAGQRYVDTVDAIANAAVEDYNDGQLIVDLTDGKVYVAFDGGWVLVGSQTLV